MRPPRIDARPLLVPIQRMPSGSRCSSRTLEPGRPSLAVKVLNAVPSNEVSPAPLPIQSGPPGALASDVIALLARPCSVVYDVKTPSFRGQCVDLAVAELVGVAVVVHHEPDAVEAPEAAPHAQPEIAVAGLPDRVDVRLRQAFALAPQIERVGGARLAGRRLGGRRAVGGERAQHEGEGHARERSPDSGLCVASRHRNPTRFQSKRHAACN
jgi:hypothetical protein